MPNLQGCVRLPHPNVGGEVVQPPVRLFDSFHARLRAATPQTFDFLFRSDAVVFKRSL